MPPFQLSRRRFVQRCAQAAALSGLPAWFVAERLAAAETAIPDVEIYQITKNGLALQATLQGTKYWRDKDLN